MKYINSTFLILLLIFTMSVSAEDKRIAVDLNEKDRESFLTEMRTLLESTHVIVVALDNNDMQTVAAVASKSKSRINIKSKELLKSLPPTFDVFAKSVQKGFTQIEASAQSGVGKDKIISLLGVQLGRCVKCHSVYKLK